jgi:hypothetical protein
MDNDSVARDVVTVVSGLPRSGTSMVMKMLEAGGLTVLTDRLRGADADNPKGYYEFERVKKLREDKAWLPEAVGKVVKVISFLLRELPAEYFYRIIFVRRAMDEVLASQRQMLSRRGEPDTTDDGEMAAAYAKHLAQVYTWLERQANISVLYVDHRRVIEAPAEMAEAMSGFLGGLDAEAMTAVVDPSLHRQRS